MTPAPPNNPGHQEAQGCRPGVYAPTRSADVSFPSGHSSAESGFCHEPQCSGNTMCAETVLNALDALLGATGKQSFVVIDRIPACKGLSPSVTIMLVAGGKPGLVAHGDHVLEALQNLVR